jgi:type III restriction enzyme
MRFLGANALLPIAFGNKGMQGITDGRVLVVEYKGSHISGMPKEIEKGQVGKVWAERSQGHALFAMVFKNLNGMNVGQQLDAAIATP